MLSAGASASAASHPLVVLSASCGDVIHLDLGSSAAPVAISLLAPLGTSTYQSFYDNYMNCIVSFTAGELASLTFLKLDTDNVPESTDPVRM